MTDEVILKRKNQKEHQHTIITIILSKAYMGYWAFKINFVSEDSYNRHYHQLEERDKENGHLAHSPRESVQG